MHGHSPFRAPDWRWRRAQWLVTHGYHFSQKRDDEATRKAVQYLRALIRGKGDLSSTSLTRFPDVWAAHRLSENGGTDKHLVQARLLAGEPAAVVAAKCALPQATVSAFETVFFDITGRLGCPDWIITHVLGPGWWAGFSEDGQVWKAVAFLGGPLALDVVLAAKRGLAFPDEARATFQGDAVYEESRLRLLSQLLVAALRARSVTELMPALSTYEAAARLDAQQVGVVPACGADLRVARCVLHLAAVQEREGANGRESAPELENKHDGTPDMKKQRVSRCPLFVE
jgi:hypothetical protein